ncbi:MAG: thiamine pyrophosphate-binding protein [Deltaproteobacteria bacterium]|nr:thiamine pyrophosphate-binding protein [Deltaproteobacteria bacterium]
MSTVYGSELVARALENEGVEFVFTLSGVPSFGVYEALRDKGIRMIDVRHEQAAVLMAQGYARSTGRTGVAMVVPGPGVLNAVTGVANCYYGSAPVVLLAGQNRLTEYQLGAFHETDQLAIMKPITKWSAAVYESRRIAEYISIAFREASTGMPGPAFVEFPHDVLDGQVKMEEAVIPERYRTTARPHGDPALVAEAVSMLAVAKRPLILFGSGIIWSNAHEELLRFVETTRIPCVPTPQARGCVPEDHPLCCFTSRSRATAQSDVILFMGVRLNFVLGFGRPPRFNPDARTIQVDVAPQEIGRNRPIDVGIVGDAGAVLKQLTEQWKSTGAVGNDSWAKELKTAEEAKKKKWSTWTGSSKKPINPVRLCHEIAQFLDRDAIVTIDGGEILDFARNLIPSYTPGARLNPGVTGLLGIGIPYAIAAKLAHPDRQVLSVCGDGAFGFNGMEMDTAARHGAPIVVVVSNNACWAVCSNMQKGIYGPDAAVCTLLSCTRYDLLAQALDCYGETVEDPDEIRPALERAFNSGKPALLNVITDPDTMSYSMSGQLKDLPVREKK